MTIVSTRTYRNEYIVLVVVSTRTYCSEYLVLVLVSTSYLLGVIFHGIGEPCKGDTPA